jgi:O-antigen/teichoic acid export membrane protein
VAWALAGSTIYSISQWLLVVALARFGSPIAVGQYSLGLAVAGPVMVSAGLGLRTLVAADARGAYSFADYFLLRAIMTLGALLVVTLIVWWVGYRWETAVVLILVAVMKAIEAFSDAFHGFLQKHDRGDWIAISLTVKAAASVSVAAVVLAFSENTIFAVSALALSSAVVFWSLDRYAVRRIDVTLPELFRQADMARSRRLFMAALPVGITLGLVSVQANVPRYYIEGLLGEWELGVFSAVSSLMFAGVVCVSAACQAAASSLARAHHAGDGRAFAEISRRLYAVAGGLGICGIIVAVFAGRSTLVFLFGGNYSVGASLFVWIMIGAMFAYVASVTGCVLLATRRLRYQPLGVTAIIGVAVFANAHWIPAHGLDGAGYAFAVTSAVAAATYGVLLVLPQDQEC